MTPESELTSRQDIGRGRSDHPVGSRNEGKQYNSHVSNVIRLPVLPSLPANSELPLGAPLSFTDHDRVAGIALTVVLGIVLFVAGLMVFAGDILFGLFDLG